MEREPQLPEVHDDWLNEPVAVGNDFEIVGYSFAIYPNGEVRRTIRHRYAGDRLASLPNKVLLEQDFHASISRIVPAKEAAEIRERFRAG